MWLRRSFFGFYCGFWATFACAAPAMDTVQNVTISKQQLVFSLADAGEAGLANIYIPSPPLAAPALTPLINSRVKLSTPQTDRYGRIQVVLTVAGDKETLQEQLLKKGLAVVYSPGGFRQSKKWMALERQAENAGRGLWGEHACDVGLCVTPETAPHHLQQFVMVSGKVTRSFKARDAYYINFGEDWKTDFSIKIPRNAWRGFGEHLAVADGAPMRVRGTIIQENGPMIVVTRPEQMEQ